MDIRQVILTVLCICLVSGYINLPLTLNRNDTVSYYNVNVQINSKQYQVGLSLSNQQQFIAPISTMKSKKKSSKTHKNPKNLFGVIKGTSLQGYTIEGWKRFFKQALLYVEQQYYQQITVNLDWIAQKQFPNNLTNGIMTFGPNVQKNKFYGEIKKNSEYITDNIVGIYSGINGKNAQLHIGGYEISYAYGYKNGILFYQLNLQEIENSWRLPVVGMSCVRQKLGKWDEIMVQISEFKPKLNINSQLLILPTSLALDIERNFAMGDSDCFIQNSRLACKNINSIDQSLSMISFKLAGDVKMNLTLYDLKDQYIQAEDKTTFFIQFTDNLNQCQIGRTLLNMHYIVFDMDRKSMFLSPVNHYPDSWFSSVYIIRFLVVGTVFCIASLIAVSIWARMNKVDYYDVRSHQKQGLRLRGYNTPGNDDQFDNE